MIVAFAVLTVWVAFVSYRLRRAIFPGRVIRPTANSISSAMGAPPIEIALSGKRLIIDDGKNVFEPVTEREAALAAEAKLRAFVSSVVR